MDAETRNRLIELAEIVREATKEWYENSGERLDEFVTVLRQKPPKSSEGPPSDARFAELDIELLTRIGHEAVSLVAWESAPEFMKASARKFTTVIMEEVLKRIAPTPKKHGARLSEAIKECVDAWREPFDAERCQISVDLYPVPEESLWCATAIDKDDRSVGEAEAPTALRAVRKLTQCAKV